MKTSAIPGHGWYRAHVKDSVHHKTFMALGTMWTDGRGKRKTPQRGSPKGTLDAFCTRPNQPAEAPRHDVPASSAGGIPSGITTPTSTTRDIAPSPLSPAIEVAASPRSSPGQVFRQGEVVPYCSVLPCGLTVEQWVCAYPWGKHADPNFCPTWIAHTSGATSVDCEGPRPDGAPCPPCVQTASDPKMVKMLHTACHPPKTTNLSLLSLGQLVDRCREYRRQIGKRDMAGLNKIRECVVLDRQVDTYKKLLFAVAQPDAPPPLGRILDVLVHRGHCASYILDVLDQAGKTYAPHYTRKEKQMGLLYWKLGCHKLAHASNQAGISPSADRCAMVLKECAVTYGPAPSVEDIHAHLPPDLPFCAFSLSIDEVKTEGDIRPMRH